MDRTIAVTLPSGKVRLDDAEAHQVYDVSFATPVFEESSEDLRELLGLALSSLGAVQLQEVLSRFGEARAVKYLKFTAMHPDRPTEIDWAALAAQVAASRTD